MSENCNDIQLLELLKASEIDAFNKIYDCYSKPLYRYLLQKIKDRDTSSDLLQDIFTTLWEKRTVLTVNTSIKAYLYQVARFKIIDVYRNNARYEDYLDQLSSFIDSEYTVIDKMDQSQKLKDVEETINSLPEKMKEIFILSRYEHKTNNDIAFQTNLSVQTVKNQISKALRALRLRHMSADVVIMIASLLFIK